MLNASSDHKRLGKYMNKADLPTLLFILTQGLCQPYYFSFLILDLTKFQDGDHDLPVFIL